MEITDIRIRKISNEGKMKAIVSLTFDDAFAVHDIKVIEGQERLFVAMPSRRTPDGEFKDIAHPINAQMREQIQTAILDRYQAALLVKYIPANLREKSQKLGTFPFFFVRERFDITAILCYNKPYKPIGI